MMTHPSDLRQIGGVDTHADVHVAATFDHLGRKLGHASFPTTAPSEAELAAWLSANGPIG